MTFSIAGPYIVECEDRELYWTVNEEDNSLTATKIIQAASFFHIIPNEDLDDDPFDFYIAWEKTPSILAKSGTGSMLRRKKSMQPAEKAKDHVLRYLQVKEGSRDEDSKVGLFSGVNLQSGLNILEGVHCMRAIV